MQSSEKLRNSLGLNYKSAALNQLSYAGKNTAHINGRCRVKQVADRLSLSHGEGLLVPVSLNKSVFDKATT